MTHSSSAPPKEIAVLPETFSDVAHLEDVMTMPSQQLIADLQALDGDIIILDAEKLLTDDQIIVHQESD